MSPLTFTLTQRPALPVDLSPLIPERLHGKKIAEIRAIPLASGNQTREVGELFKVTGRDPSHIVIHPRPRPSKGSAESEPGETRRRRGLWPRAAGAGDRPRGWG
jgi:hypothetical protein